MSTVKSLAQMMRLPVAGGGGCDTCGSNGIVKKEANPVAARNLERVRASRVSNAVMAANLDKISKAVKKNTALENVAEALLEIKNAEKEAAKKRSLLSPNKPEAKGV